MKITALKQLDLLASYDKDQFTQFITSLCEDLDNYAEIVQTVTKEVDMTVFEKISIGELLEAAILVCTQNIQNDIRYDKVATRILLASIYRHALKDFQGASDMSSVYADTFTNYINYGVERKLLHPDMVSVYSQSEIKELASYLKPEQDEIFEFVGLDTALKRYMKQDWNQTTLETPQFMWMRISMWMAIKENNKLLWAKKFYDKLSEMRYVPGGSTNIGAGTTYPTLSNCYILDTEDDTNAIYDNVKNIALISKATGGIGISVTKLRASGSPVKSNNTFSTGPIPFVKVMDTALKSMSRAGKKYGAMCVYMENWHYDFPEFIDLKQNAGDDYRRLRTANTAVYLSDEFMKRVEANEMWYLFDPADTPDLTELYGSEFGRRYEEYCKKAESGEIKMFRKVLAREQMKAILTSLLATSHPWLTWKDPINLRALNNNTGTIHSSNLCTEICLPEDRENIAVCNLAYINVSTHVLINADGSAQMDWENLRDSVRVATRHLDNLVDVNELSVPEAKKSDHENRAVGLGMAGIAEVFEKFGVPYDSEEAYKLIDEITEFISYHSIDTSADLAQEKGKYSHFDGSMWSKGFVPYDTIELLNRDRNSSSKQSSSSPVQNGINVLQSKIDSKIENVQDPELREIYSAVKELTSYLSKLSPEPTLSSNNSNESVNFNLKQNADSKLDWTPLREKVKKGMRNATLMAIAPNASTGLVLGTSPGIDVRFSQIFSRATSRGKYLDINKNLVRDLQKLNLWEKFKNQILESYGDISNIDEIPQHLKDVYKTSFQVSPYGAIEVASRAQKWIDQAMSRNMYLETRDVNELTEIYMEAWKRGLKTTYYLHTKPRHSAEQSTVKVNKSKSIHKVGFANAIRNGSIPSEVSVNVSETVSFNSQGALGFGKVAIDQTNKKVEFTIPEKEPAKIPEPVLERAKSSSSSATVSDQIMKACPLDPAERALCESCQ